MSTSCTTTHPAPGVTVHSTPDATVRVLGREAMLLERADLLSTSSMPEDELRAAGAAWTLDATHRGILARIDGLDFLIAHAGPA